MNITTKFLGTSRYYICATTELYKVETPIEVMSLDTALGIAKDLVLHHDFAHANIIDGDTGVVFAEIDREEEEEDINYDTFDRYWELGYNPYMGECDDDC